VSRVNQRLCFGTVHTGQGDVQAGSDAVARRDFAQINAGINGQTFRNGDFLHAGNGLHGADASGDQLANGYIAEHVSYLEGVIKRLQSDIDDHIAGQQELNVDVQLLTSIPGLGSVTVAKVLAHVSNASRFATAKALSAFAGACLQQRVSGTSVKGRTLVSKREHADLRKALYMPGMLAMRHNPLIKDVAQRL
jgi:transposase